MTRPTLVIYDDGRGNFGPMTDRRPAFSLRTGVVTNRVRIEVTLDQMAAMLVVPARLAQAQRARETDALVNVPFCELNRDRPVHLPDGRPGAPPERVDEVLLVNGRWLGFDTGRAAASGAIRELTIGHAAVQSDGELVAARLRLDHAQRLVDTNFASLPPHVVRHALDADVLLTRPWHIIAHLEATAAHDLSATHTAPTAKVHPTVVIDDTLGPVVIDEHATVGAFTAIDGPVYVGPHTVVQPHTLLRPRTVIGPSCKVAGEISFSILHGHTNKAHFGYLGHSLVGEWCNLGAGTTVSNLKNTYGSVRITLPRPPHAGPERCSASEGPGEPEDTKLPFHGPILGDFVRTAIGSRILTGSCLGTATMLALSSFAPKFTPAGAYLTDDEATTHDPDKLIATARAMLARRSMTLPPEEEALLRSLLPV